MSIRYAICNEMFGDWEFSKICETAAQAGYEGLEIAPYPLAPLVTDLTRARRAEIHAMAGSFGLHVVGLHWLLAYTNGLELTSPHLDVQERTGQYLVELTRCCRDLGGEVMVLGSPQRRRVPVGHTLEQAANFAAATIGHALDALRDQDVTLALEPLGPEETDFWNTCDQVLRFVDRIGHPNIKLHLDVKAMATESTPIPELIRKHGPIAAHFHANDANRNGPGFGATDFRSILKALGESGYDRWVSVEVFDVKPSPETVAFESIRHLRSCEFRPDDESHWRKDSA